VSYLLIAYAFAVALLGGYLFLSLRQLRELERPTKRYSSEPAPPATLLLPGCGMAASTDASCWLVPSPWRHMSGRICRRASCSEP
jgi:hypothetical protein